jgi:hypothetical protein
MNEMSVSYLHHYDIGRVVAQHDKTGLHRPIAEMYEAWSTGRDVQCLVRDETVLQELLAALARDGKFREAPQLKGPPGTNPGVEDGRTRLSAAYEHSMHNPDFTLEVVIP